MCHTWKYASHLEKWVTLRTILEKCVTLGYIPPTWKNESHLKKWATLDKNGHNWKNDTQKIGSSLENTK